ncbi:sugar phosphate isomerase/epimerase [Paenibacillus sp. J2TS4]|uniref:sugar phosphate isomerase/epimerase family protein n=1 Tax=Paenibacillus sp. J2TS4 TaxID=2807194 RepID=UPI001B2F8302|nr:sugar phosphate isomerase/epimerase family protein [Paenibacillus sp. J2TS4]GIP31539.1 sugar phosphate isomerase [Paenibacillus sp. J2TS4]
MKIGLSSYSLSRLIKSGEMTLLEAIQWVSENGGEHVEIVPIGFDLIEEPSLIEAIRNKAADVGIDISNYAVGANFITDSKEGFDQQVELLKKHVDIVHGLGAKLMRHDVASRPIPETSIAQFEADLETMVEGCRQVADYAAQFGITTSVENHGYFVQASDRVQRLIHAVDRPNFKTTLDVGNFMCADENSVVAVKKNVSYASMVHLKDFYLRPSYRNPGEGWFPTASGNFLRGAIVGHGDIDMVEVIRVVKQSGYDGYISIEFEGMEDPRTGSKIGMANARRIWEEV